MDALFPPVFPNAWPGILFCMCTPSHAPAHLFRATGGYASSLSCDVFPNMYYAVLPPLGMVRLCYTTFLCYVLSTKDC